MHCHLHCHWHKGHCFSVLLDRTLHCHLSCHWHTRPPLSVLVGPMPHCCWGLLPSHCCSEQWLCHICRLVSLCWHSRLIAPWHLQQQTWTAANSHNCSAEHANTEGLPRQYSVETATWSSCGNPQFTALVKATQRLVLHRLKSPLLPRLD